MAANYWTSTQYQHWLFSREALSAMHAKLEKEEKDLIQQHALPDRRLLNVFFNQRQWEHL